MGPIAAIVMILIVLVIVVIYMYNTMVTLRNMVDNAWAQVEVQLQRRLDLIPNLVETVKGYASHESQTLEAVTAARTAYMNATTTDEKVEANNALSGALKSLFAVAESYPSLMASQNFVDLQKQLSETEDKVSYMRQSFNDTVLKYNNAVQTFPGSLVSKPFGFFPRNSFIADLGAEAAPVVDFGTRAGANPNEAQ